MTGEKKTAATKYHRKTLMTTADMLLVEHGYDGMNMNMLAKEAGYSKATVYVYFRSKAEIVAALAVERLELLRRELGLLLKSDFASEEMLGEIKKVLTEFATDDNVYFEFVTSDVVWKSVDDGTAEAQNIAKLRELIRGIVEDLTYIIELPELKRRWYEFYGEIKTRYIFS